jgi:hypothetical protein
MSAVALDKPVRPAAPPRAVLRAVSDATTDDAAEVQLWEAHSELAFVSPEVRLRLLELLPEPVDSLAPRQRPIVPVPIAAPTEAKPAVRAGDLLRYAALRVGQTIRLGLTIVGAIFVLALLAEVLAH